MKMVKQTEFGFMKANQSDVVMNHLSMKGTITALEALSLYRIFRLAGRIHDLKRNGVKIEPRMKKDVTGKRYAEYRLA